MTLTRSSGTCAHDPPAPIDICGGAFAATQGSQVDHRPATVEKGVRRSTPHLFEARELIQEALTQFTPEERRKFVGVLRNPANKWAQLLQGDKRFQEWQALTKQIQQIKFSFGGLNLTRQENYIIEGFLPTGSEWGGGEEFEVKATRFSREALAAIQARLRAAKSRGALEQEFSTTTTTTTTPGAPTMSVEEWLAR